MPDTEKMENVKVELTARITVMRDNWDGTNLVNIQRAETGRFTLNGAQARLQHMADEVLSRCALRVEERVVEAQRKLEVKDD